MTSGSHIHRPHAAAAISEPCSTPRWALIAFRIEDRFPARRGVYGIEVRVSLQSKIR